MQSRSRRLNQSFCLAFVFCFCIVHFCCCTETVPALFAFGDSNLDPGNNNDLLSVVRCNFPPYGRDFQGQEATGRFCNGRLPTDFLIEGLGIKANVPAYLSRSLRIEDLLTGVSFASGGSGYDVNTSSTFSSKSLEDQLNMFEEYRRRLKAVVGVNRMNFILRNSIFIIAFGSCDLANTYFTFSLRRLYESVDSYTDLMLQRATFFLKRLYELGVRKIGVANVPPLGYLPAQRTLGGGPFRECPEDHNQAAQFFNTKLKATLPNLSTRLYGSKLVYLDIYSIFLDLILNHTHYGFEVIDRGCCGSGLVEVAVLCNPFSLTCDNHLKYLFWDSYHPTEKGYQLLAKRVQEDYFHLFF